MCSEETLCFHLLIVKPVFCTPPHIPVRKFLAYSTLTTAVGHHRPSSFSAFQVSSAQTRNTLSKTWSHAYFLDINKKYLTSSIFQNRADTYVVQIKLLNICYTISCSQST